MKMRRTVLSGIKKPTNGLTTSKNTKNPTLFDHTSKIQQKLTKLKQQLQEKKKNNFSKTKPSIQKTTIIDKQLSEFLTNINMGEYLQLLCDNGIDSMDIMREIKQKQLEQIGISKGHSLKIIVSLRKMLETRQKKLRKQLSSAQTAQNTQKVTSKAHRKTQQKKNNDKQEVFITKNQPLEIVIQTEVEAIGTGEQPLPKRRYFCLYCYQVSMHQFCGSDCQQMYNKMFQKYQKNLAQVHELYGGKIKRLSEISKANQQVNQDQLIDNLHFLDLQEEQQQKNFNQQEYKEALQFIKAINYQNKQQQITKTLQEKQQFQNQKIQQ